MDAGICHYVVHRFRNEQYYVLWSLIYHMEYFRHYLFLAL